MFDDRTGIERSRSTTIQSKVSGQNHHIMSSWFNECRWLHYIQDVDGDHLGRSVEEKSN